MRVEPGERARDDGSASAWVRIRLLPRQVLLVALLLLLSALIPVVGELVAVLGIADGSIWLRALARHAALVSGLTLAAATVALLVLEHPRTRSAGAYARQLADRLAAVQADFDGALRRRAGGEEEERHAPELHPSER